MGECGIWWWWWSRDEYCECNPGCADCPKEDGVGVVQQTALPINLAPQAVNQQAALLTLMLRQDYREVLKDRPMLKEAFRVNVLPHILRAGGLQLLDEFARSLSGDAYTADEFKFAQYFALFSEMRVRLRELVQAVQTAPSLDQAAKLVLFFQPYGLQLKEVQALDLARVGTSNPHIAMSCAEFLARQNEFEAALAAYNHVPDLAQVYDERIELTKAALQAQIDILMHLGREGEVERLKGFMNSLA